jgi:hypothetical protein
MTDEKNLELLAKELLPRELLCKIAGYIQPVSCDHFYDKYNDILHDDCKKKLREILDIFPYTSCDKYLEDMKITKRYVGIGIYLNDNYTDNINAQNFSVSQANVCRKHFQTAVEEFNILLMERENHFIVPKIDPNQFFYLVNTRGA